MAEGEAQELKRYEAVVNGQATILKLNDADAKAMGLNPSWGRAIERSEPVPVGVMVEEKKRTAANK